MIHTIDSERQANEQDYYTMQEMKHKFETGEEKVTATKMRNLYKGCVEDANREESLIREALDEIIEIRNIRNERRLQVRCVYHYIFTPFMGKKGKNLNKIIISAGSKCWY